MANIYTKTGDKGTTSLFGGERVSKDSLRVECYGTIDEANSMMGLAYSLCNNDITKNHIHTIQQRLFVLGAELASSSEGLKMLTDTINKKDIEYLESILDHCILMVGKQTEFVIPGENTVSAVLHSARTIVRRAERNVIRLKETLQVRADILKYINRLSDCIFALARIEEHENLIAKITKKVMESLNMKNNDKFNIEVAKELAKYAEEKSKQINVPMIISVVDSGGNLILFHRMEDSILVSIDISINKAYTANALKMPTNELADLTQPGQALYGLQNTNNNRIVIFGGGYPIYVDGKVVGGFGISGGSVEEDMTVAEYAIEKVGVMK